MKSDRTSIKLEATQATSIDWYVWSVVAAATLYDIGFYWDISWHQTIGRDSVLNPAHVAIYLCGVIGGISSAYVILSTTFGKNEAAREAAVKVWGFYAPLGAFIVAWGGLVMLTSGPFDNWWHRAYGLDAKLNSPPHWVLTTGVFAIQMGGIVLLAGAINRASEELRAQLNLLVLHLGAMIIALPLALLNDRVLQHSVVFYAGASAAVPGVMLAAASLSRQRWASTTLAATYTAFVLSFLWILPLFHGSPVLGPVYRKITHFVPPQFPVLIVAPALFMDYAHTRWPARNPWLQSAIYGAIFLVILFATQWPFADFLMSSHARNWVFGAQHLPYYTAPSGHLARNEFLVQQSPLRFCAGLFLAFIVAVIGSRVGLAAGDWLRCVRR